MRVVVDTNVIISAAISKKSTSFLALELVIDFHKPLISDHSSIFDSLRAQGVLFAVKNDVILPMFCPRAVTDQSKADWTMERFLCDGKTFTRDKISIATYGTQTLEYPKLSPGFREWRPRGMNGSWRVMTESANQTLPQCLRKGWVVRPVDDLNSGFA